MKMEISEAVDRGYLKRALEMRTIPVEKEEDFRKEFVFEKEPEILTRGHVAARDDLTEANTKRVNKIAERAALSNYGRLLPTRRSFPTMVRIASCVISFIDKCRQRVNMKKGLNIQFTGPLLSDAQLYFSAFPCAVPQSSTAQAGTSKDSEAPIFTVITAVLHGLDLERFSRIQAASEGTDKPAPPIPSDKYLNMALLYYFRQASKEVLSFNNKQVVERKTVMKEGVLLSRGRILDGMNFLETADLDTINLGSLGIKTMIPVVDRYSPHTSGYVTL